MKNGKILKEHCKVNVKTGKKISSTYSDFRFFFFFQSSSGDIVASFLLISHTAVLSTVDKTSTLLSLAQSGIRSKLSPIVYTLVHGQTWITFLTEAVKHCCDSSNNTNNGLSSSGH